MQQNFSKITFLTGNVQNLINMRNVKVLPMFSEKIREFLYCLSSEILNDRRAKTFPDVSSYAFWIRKAHIEREMEKHQNIERRIGRGVALHIAPSNVPVNFAVSFTSSLLAGNACIVRVSNKDFEQVNIICDAINNVIKNKMPEMADYIVIIRHEHDEELTKILTSMCDIRIIWGGNTTVETIRKANLPPRAIEMTFADRHSLAIINSDEYLNQDSAKIAKDFYIDTYYTDQNACSSPRLVVWTGNSIDKAKEVFWYELEKLLKKDYSLQPIQAINKLDSFCNFASNNQNIKLIKNDNYIFRVEIPQITSDLMEYKENSGYFFEYSTQNLNDIIPIMNKSCQTISYLGIDKNEIKKIVYNNGTKGVDRIVPIGKTMDISFIWDGYNMIESMTRIVDVI